MKSIHTCTQKTYIYGFFYHHKHPSEKVYIEAKPFTFSDYIPFQGYDLIQSKGHFLFHGN